MTKDQLTETASSLSTTSQQQVLNKVVEMIRLMGETGLAELELETAELKMSLRKDLLSASSAFGPEPSIVARQPSPQTLSANAALLSPGGSSLENGNAAGGGVATATATAVAPVASVVPASETRSHHVLQTPMAGTFYHAPSPTSAPFVKEGDLVARGQTVCIVEAMKLMNEIKADVAGKIVKILAENGQMVEKHTDLYWIQPQEE